MRRRPPPLTEDDKQVWKQVTETVVPLEGHPPFIEPVSAPPQPVHIQIKTPDGPRKKTVHAAPTQLDKPTVRRIRARRLPVEGRIDLHDMTLDVAHSALVRFILLAAEKRQRTLLVITGKGRTEMGKIRREFPHWLEQPPLRSLVIGFHVAHREDGGEGAYYVRIRH